MTKPDMLDFKGVPLEKSLEKNLENIRRITGKSSDLLENPIIINGVKCNLICYEGMISTSTITELILHPLMNIDIGQDHAPETLLSHVKNHMLMTIDRGFSEDYGDLIRRAMSGFAILLIDGVAEACAFGVQGYAVRGIDEPNGEGNVKGAHEGFVEVVRTNMSLVRRRMKSPLLRFELFPISDCSNTDVIVCYMADRVPKETVESIKKRLKSIKLETILGSGYIEPFLDNSKLSLFSGVSVTERPDSFCGKLLEGRVGIMIDGTPYAIIVPYLFIENFQTMDDYNMRPYYAAFIRIIKFAAFLLAIFLPGIYVAAATFHPEMFRYGLMLKLAEAEKDAPLPLMAEAIIVLLIYEVVREAGLRLPQNVGGAVSIVGGLIIGDAAVSGGLISNPLLVAVALAVTASFVVPNLNQPITLLRFVCVIVGGFWGFFGVSVLAAVVLVNICSIESCGIPVTAPLSPFTLKSMRDVFVRLGFKSLEKGHADIGNMKGANYGRNGHFDEQ
ncbi:MAG: spore germination protein [Ruminococcus sp.]|nr:spore germination protein [Ruminococcus sp.]